MRFVTFFFILPWPLRIDFLCPYWLRGYPSECKTSCITFKGMPSYIVKDTIYEGKTSCFTVPEGIKTSRAMHPTHNDISGAALSGRH